MTMSAPKQQRAFDGNRRGQKTIHQRASLELYGHEQPGIRARPTQRRTEQAARVIDGDARIDVRGGDRQRDGEFLESFHGSEAREIFFHALIGGEAEPRGRPAAKIGEGSGPRQCVPFLRGHARAIASADERADTGTCDNIDGNAGLARSREARRYARCRAQSPPASARPTRGRSFGGRVFAAGQGARVLSLADSSQPTALATLSSIISLTFTVDAASARP